MEKETTKRERILTVKMSRDEYSNLQEVARLEGSNMSDFIRRATLKKKREYQQKGFWEK